MHSHRRHFLSLVVGGSLLTLSPVGSLFAAPGVRLVPTAQEGSFRRLTAVVELEGELKLNPDGKKITTKPIQVIGKYEFDEKLLALPVESKTTKTTNPLRVVRHYTQAQAEIKLDRGSFKNTLRDDLRLIGAQATNETATLFCPLGPLTRDELELLRIPGEPLMWNRLLPTEEVQPGATWKPSDVALAMLLNIEVVTSNDVQAKFVGVEGQLAMMELSGNVVGAIGGVGTEFEIKAKYNFDQSQGQVTWLALGLKEKRAIGHAEPGFEVTSRVRISATPRDSSGYLTEQMLNDVRLKFDPGMALLTHNSTAGGFELLHDRRWQVMADHRETTILRLVDNGDLIAQCNISRLHNQPEGKHLALDAFQREVTSTLGKNFGQIVEADQTTTDRGLRQLRVLVSGAAQDVPVQWTYYHLADNEGRGAAIVFTMDATLVERFADLDRAMVGSLTLKSRAMDDEPLFEPEADPQADQPATAQPTAAKPSTATKK